MKIFRYIAFLLKQFVVIPDGSMQVMNGGKK